MFETAVVFCLGILAIEAVGAALFIYFFSQDNVPEQPDDEPEELCLLSGKECIHSSKWGMAQGEQPCYSCDVAKEELKNRGKL